MSQPERQSEQLPAPDALPAIDGLPDPFMMANGSRVATAEDWAARRREITAMLLGYEYGHMPPAPGSIAVEKVVSRAALDGAAIEKQVVLCMGPEGRIRMRAGLFVPTKGDGAHPAILAVEPVWLEHLEPVAARVVDAGYALAGFERHDLDADSADRTDGAHPVYPEYDWASLAVWAWGCMLMMDYLDMVEEVDATRVAITGHSRAGKVALLAGALDERIAVVAPHASGAGGAGSYRIVGNGSETLALITEPERFHYWFHPRLAGFAGKEERLPFDQHFLRALVAPRTVVSVEGLGDKWANPLGTQQMYVAAQPVFDFLGASDKNGIYFRPGGHDMTMEDWDVLLDVAGHFLLAEPAARDYTQLPYPDVERGFSWTAPAEP
ncbi:MAG: acetylxylan esterase [Candidatus Hydrogenedentes bacterium]|nr:acetylxylan esterase [Candidatus Hydrogenedentota bacterium]